MCMSLIELVNDRTQRYVNEALVVLVFTLYFLTKQNTDKRDKLQLSLSLSLSLSKISKQCAINQLLPFS